LEYIHYPHTPTHTQKERRNAKKLSRVCNFSFFLLFVRSLALPSATTLVENILTEFGLKPLKFFHLSIHMQRRKKAAAAAAKREKEFFMNRKKNETFVGWRKNSHK
jgi:hypothetical protein